MCPWNPNIPQAGNKLRNSQLDLLNNNQAIDAGFDFNHVNLDLAGAGKHKLLTMPRQTLPQPAVNNLGDDLLMYVAQDVSASGTNLSEVYLKRDTDLATTGTPFTAKVTTSNGASGWSYLPSGLFIQWGSVSSTGPGHTNATLTYPRTFGGGGNTYTIVYCADWNGQNATPLVQLTGQSATGATFALRGSVPAVVAGNQWSVKYYAIGLKV